MGRGHTNHLQLYNLWSQLDLRWLPQPIGCVKKTHAVTFSDVELKFTIHSLKTTSCNIARNSAIANIPFIQFYESKLFSNKLDSYIHA